jgi:bifunctional non-homologous end joining protein LigD
VSANAIPSGPDWLHEVKFDGYRVQIHKAGKDVVIFSRNGHDFTTRFDTVAYLLHGLPAKTATLDGEIVASNGAGVPELRQAAPPRRRHPSPLVL